MLSILMVLSVRSLSGQLLGPDPEFVDFNSPEGWATQYFSSILLPTGFGVPRAMERWEWELGLEISHIPQLSLEKQRVGFGGSKVDDLNHARFLPRPTATVGLPYGFSATVSFMPPVKMWGLKSTLASLSINRPLWEDGNWRTGMRAFFSYGESQGAFTCSQWLVDGGHDPFNCVPPSHDTSYLHTAGFEFSASYTFVDFHRLTPYITVSWQHMNNHFQTNSLIFDGTARDQRTLKTDGDTVAYSGGLELPVGQHWTLAAGLFYSPLEVVRSTVPGTTSQNDSLFNVRSQVRFRF